MPQGPPARGEAVGSSGTGSRSACPRRARPGGCPRHPLLALLELGRQGASGGSAPRSQLLAVWGNAGAVTSPRRPSAPGRRTTARHPCARPSTRRPPGWAGRPNQAAAAHPPMRPRSRTRYSWLRPPSVFASLRARQPGCWATGVGRSAARSGHAGPASTSRLPGRCPRRTQPHRPRRGARPRLPGTPQRTWPSRPSGSSASTAG
mmetsp:Transcript_62364/g.140567  ORF Transcript_62364/g.140567 Transcript_62364/m.140567 type:complete len:205 (+) Transcript_62364:411-1025(+)